MVRAKLMVGGAALGLLLFVGQASGAIGTVAPNTVDDVTAPTATIVTPADGAFYHPGQIVDASYHCDDEAGGSGVATCVGDVADGAAIDTSTEGQHPFTVTATDIIGNASHLGLTYHVTDQTAPTIEIAAPLDGDRYTQNEVVDADYTCHDEAGGSGVATCLGDVAGGQPIDTSTVGPHTFRVDATDVAGNAAMLTVGYVVDAPPVVTVTTPQEGASYDQGAVVAAAYACTDAAGDSEIASCLGPVASGSPIDTSTAGDHTFTVVATDKAGETTTVTRHYSVVSHASAGVASAPVAGPDLGVDLTAGATAAPPVGSQLVYVVRVFAKNGQSASDVQLSLTLPAGYVVTKTYADRGSGCRGTAPNLVCDLAWIGPASTVTITGTVTQAGELDATASVRSVVEPEVDPSDNTATLKLEPAVAKPVAPPVLESVGGRLTPPRAAHVGRAAIVKVSFSVNEPVALTITVHGQGAQLRKILRASTIAGARTGKLHGQLVYGVNQARTVPLLLRIGYRSLVRGQTYRILVVATTADGRSSRLVIPFRL
jgi:Domain of unknown function DUF11